jgi:diaminohydroxyphosphoribosylaminopyrimidine deaminase/5-amino-6-(5-phosphoribosylamino)uracil reductase
MHRCLQLARLGAGHVAPNPMVGAVLVFGDKIIGEGYHRKYGEAHAEVNCLENARQNGHGDLISQSTLYVSLEPCAHYGKTPPCADLLIRHRIPKVVIGCRDPFTEVNGKGIDKLKAAGIETVVGVLEKECIHLNRRFFCFYTQHRPYIILKWAETADHFIAFPEPGADPHRLLISNEYTKRLVHKWRSEEAAILVGTNTVIHDDPQLTTRLWSGPSPVRLVIDMDLRLSSFLKIFDGKVKTIVFNRSRHEENDPVGYYQVTDDVSLVAQVCHALYQMKIQSVIVEGGAKLLQSFIDDDSWDEARVITNDQLSIGRGLPAPRLVQAQLDSEEILLGDRISLYFHHPEQPGNAAQG